MLQCQAGPAEQSVLLSREEVSALRYVPHPASPLHCHPPGGRCPRPRSDPVHSAEPCLHWCGPHGVPSAQTSRCRLAGPDCRQQSPRALRTVSRAAGSVRGSFRAHRRDPLRPARNRRAARPCVRVPGGLLRPRSLPSPQHPGRGREPQAGFLGRPGVPKLVLLIQFITGSWLLGRLTRPHPRISGRRTSTGRVLVGRRLGPGKGCGLVPKSGGSHPSVKAQERQGRASAGLDGADFPCPGGGSDPAPTPSSGAGGPRSEAPQKAPTPTPQQRGDPHVPGARGPAGTPACTPRCAGAPLAAGPGAQGSRERGDLLLDVSQGAGLTG